MLTVRSLVRMNTDAHHESHKRILKQVEGTITQQNGIGASSAWVQVPQWLYGMPVVDPYEAAAFVQSRLAKGGFYCAVHPQTDGTVWLHVDWGAESQRLVRTERARRNAQRRKARQQAGGGDGQKASAAGRQGQGTPVTGGQLLAHLQNATRRRGAKAQ